MSPRPRNILNSHGIKNLFFKRLKDGRIHIQYRDRRSAALKAQGLEAKEWLGWGIAKSLSSPEIHQAKVDATHMNAIIDAGIAQARVMSQLNQGPQKSKGITLSAWLVRYMEIQNKRLAAGTLKYNTLKTRRSAVKQINGLIGGTLIKAVTVKQVKREVIDHFVGQDKNRMAKVIRSTLIDIYREAMQEGEVSAGFNPAESTKNPIVKVNTARFTLENFKLVLAEAESFNPWVANSMLLGLLTGQRREDISKMKFNHIKNGFLEVVQGKTGRCVKIPLKLKLNAIDLSLEDVIKRCRDRVLSKYLIHHTQSHNNAKPGSAVHKDTITRICSKARDQTDLNWPGFKPPAFHEIRSLSEREYSKQGINTQALLGHLEAKTTAMYHDDRGHDWTIVEEN